VVDWLGNGFPIKVYMGVAGSLRHKEPWLEASSMPDLSDQG